MPRSTREYLIRFYDQTTNDLDRALSNLKKMSDIYDPDYPDHAVFVQQLSAMLVTIQELLTRFRWDMM